MNQLSTVIWSLRIKTLEGQSVKDDVAKNDEHLSSLIKEIL